MRAVILYAHPYPKSFNAAVLSAVQEELLAKGIDYSLRDLYTMNFDPVLTCQELADLAQERIPDEVRFEQAEIASSDLIIFIFPLWWMGPPAILRGYIDRVFSEGFAYRPIGTGAEGLLSGKQALLFITYGADREFFVNSGLRAAVDLTLHFGTLKFCGIEVREQYDMYAVPTITQTERESMIREVRNIIRRL